MPNGIYTTVIGNIVAAPELRFTQNGTAVANLTIANTPRFLKDGEWKDGETTFVRCNVWNTYAENVADSFYKGQHVIAYGRIAQRQWETPEGEKRYTWEMTVDEIGHSLRFGTTEFTKTVGNNTPPLPEEKNVAVKKSKTQPKTSRAKAKPAPADDDPWAGQDIPPAEPPY
jgi:single-strand DNA-binding protein